MSSGRPARRTGVILAKLSSEPLKRPSAIAFSSIGVTTMPGGMVLTVIPLGPSSSAKAFVNPINPAFELT